MITLMTTRQSPPAAGEPWVFLGQDFLTLRRLEDELGADRRISIAAELETAAGELTEEFVAWVSAQGERAGFTPAWWMTNLAGHSVSNSPFFLNLCHLRILEKVLPGLRDANLFIVCEDWFQLRAVELAVGRAGRSHRRLAGWRTHCLADQVRLLLRWGARWIKSLVVTLGALRSAAVTRESPGSPAPRVGDGPTALVLTCVDESCLGQDGVFRDRYFPGLAEGLEKQGWRVRTIPWLYHLRRPSVDAYRWFRAQGDRFLFLEDHARWWEVGPAALTVLRSALLWQGAGEFRQWDIRPLIARERINDSSAAGRMRYLLHYPALRRWVAQGGQCQVYIEMFENLPHERPALRAMRELLPGTMTVGYQHIGGMAADFVNYRITPAEWSGGGFPQRIVANSVETAARLRAQGFPVEAVEEGPALRYCYLKKDLTERPGGEANGLLVLLPLDLQGAAELLLTLRTQEPALQTLGLAVRLKAHPMCPAEPLRLAVGVPAWPDNWEWVQGAVQEHFAAAAVVLGYGSALLDAAASAVPFISLRRETGLTSNPLEAWSVEFPECANTPREAFAARVRELVGGETRDRARRIELACRIRDGLGACEAEAVNAFLPTAWSERRVD